MGTLRFGALNVCRGEERPPALLGGGFSKLPQVTPHALLPAQVFEDTTLRGTPFATILYKMYTGRNAQRSSDH